MITLTQKKKVILKHLDGISNRAISNELHMSKDTVNKYVREYPVLRVTVIITYIIKIIILIY